MVSIVSDASCVRIHPKSMSTLRSNASQRQLISFAIRLLKTVKKIYPGDNAARFLESGGWKTRLSGRELKFSQEELFEFDEEKGLLKFTAKNLRPEWKIWYKTLGDIHECSESEYHLEYDGVVREVRFAYQWR